MWIVNCEGLVYGGLFCAVVWRSVRVVMYYGRGVRAELWSMLSAGIKMWFVCLRIVW